ncbi:MAG TPA: CerR family C-terminal domain-containing protein [Myxococcota bacterium]|jgi:AcrR family transcriptional regulator
MERDDPQTTRRRILSAAGELFAERGFRATTMREIAQRARVNLAAANYHFGSKQDLYLEVVRGEFEKLEKRLSARGASPGAPLDRLSRKDLEEMLRLRVESMLETVLDASSVHGAIMQREMVDPSDALPVIVKQFIDPQRRAMDRLVARLEPALAQAEVERCTRSLVGQIFFYLTHRPALLLLMGRSSYPRGLTRDAANHITAFSLGGLEKLAAERREGRARHAS